MRTIDRARLRLRLVPSDVVGQRAAVLEQLRGFEIVPMDVPILDRAAEPFPTPLGSLDAIHLASAVLARATIPDLVVATHDDELATAARAVGFEVLGAA